MAKPAKQAKSADEQLVDSYTDTLLKSPKMQTVTVSRDHYLWIAQTLTAKDNRIAQLEAEKRQEKIFHDKEIESLTEKYQQRDSPAGGKK